MLTTYSFQNLRRDLSDVFATIVAGSPTFLSKIPIVGTARHYKHEWVEDVVQPTEDALDGAIDNAVTTVTVDDGGKFKAGMILGFVGYDEQMKVTAIDVDDLTVTRGYGGTTPEAMSDNTVVRILYIPAAEGSEPGDDSWEEPGIEYNYTQIFTRTVRVSNTARSSRHLMFEDLIDRGVRDGMSAVRQALLFYQDDPARHSIRLLIPGESSRGYDVEPYGQWRAWFIDDEPQGYGPVEAIFITTESPAVAESDFSNIEPWVVE